MLTLVVQMTLAILDLIGVAVLGVLGALAIRGVQSQKTGDRTAKFLEFVGMSNLSLQQQVAILGSIATLFLVGRTLFSMFMSHKILHFLSSRSASISSTLLSKMLANETSTLINENAVKLQYILGPGVSAIGVGILGTFANMVGDFSLLIVISAGIIFVNTEIAIFSILIFGGVGLLLYFKLHLRAEKIGHNFAELTMSADRGISELIYGNREIYVRDRRQHYLDEITRRKQNLAYFYAENAFIPNISKYVIEITVVVGAMLVSALEFIRLDAAHAVAGLAIFLVAGTRVAPALLRLQQGFIAMKSHLGIANETLTSIYRLKSLPELKKNNAGLKLDHPNFQPTVKIEKMVFRYSENPNFELNIPRLEIKSGETVAIVGPSGSGKSTIVDLLLGLNHPKSGTISISGVSPEAAITTWPGAIGYVPQDIFISDASILENVALGFSESDIRVDVALKALEQSQLLDYLNSLPDGIHSMVGNRGSKLSGGQKQRLGIARALYTSPKFLILDEATSALDGVVENDLSLALNNLRNSVTLVIVAHRLSTVKMADNILYVENGRIQASGTFDQLREKVPHFDLQAKLSGL